MKAWLGLCITLLWFLNRKILKQKVIAEELKEMSENFNKYISEIETLNVRPETKAAVNQTKLKLRIYQSAKKLSHFRSAEKDCFIESGGVSSGI